MKWIFTITTRGLALLWLLFAGCQETASEADSHRTEEHRDQGCFLLSNLIADGAKMMTEGGAPFSGKVCTYFKDGGLHTLTTFVDGVRVGTWEVYYPNGQVHKQGAVSGGEEDGPYLEYFPHGQLKYEYHYERGERVGVWKSWYEDGTPYTERHFAQGVIHGKVLVWDEQGRLAKEYDYRNGSVVRSQMHFENFD